MAQGRRPPRGDRDPPRAHESVAGDELDLDAFVPGDRSVEDQIASAERLRRSAEALRALKPDEAKALMMKAHGLSYAEIGERCGWSYTKVNRAITEGRRRFMAAYAGIESGEDCERFGPWWRRSARAPRRPPRSSRSARTCATAPRAEPPSATSTSPRVRRASLFWPIFVVAEPLSRWAA